METRYSLLKRLQDPDDPDSWKEFISVYEQYVYNILRRFGLSVSETEELQQNIIVKLWKALPEYRMSQKQGQFRGWLKTVIKNEAVSYLRKNIRRRELMEKENTFITNHLHDEDQNDEISKIIDEEWKYYITDIAWEHVKERFQENVQEVFVLSLEGKSTKEIAAQCGIKEESVRVYRQRIRDVLKKEITKIDQEFS